MFSFVGDGGSMPEYFSGVRLTQNRGGRVGKTTLCCIG